jgi:hypothetical protein
MIRSISTTVANKKLGLALILNLQEEIHILEFKRLKINEEKKYCGNIRRYRRLLHTLDLIDKSIEQHKKMITQVKVKQ